MGKLQKCMRTSLVAFAQFHDQEMARLREVFLEADKDCSGEVSVDELAAVLCSDADVNMKKLLPKLDTSCNGVIVFSEWLAAAAHDALFSDREGARRAFDALDSDGDGHITIDELRNALPGVFRPGELEVQFLCFDSNGDGSIDFEEFAAALRNDQPDMSGWSSGSSAWD